ncbi:protein phosphatase 2C domain-containing protein [Isoptericola sp. b441]|uniref:Protein phosphatase 2C domain-containing protein n=1 Tax=Actinotalea lenta TaxID=3064654 RepID=A0ABT9D508_9CELL|nr:MULTISPECIES: protein phosphatase 2C domain-containing protein [unclassified Isoptericola]MDO8105783.1 protein phosphatase 2C domain-containing protein [Isoptericola sp. b441]MDO8122488.1 protein phosphatase 2C domain-containing protein [Isoptericola sp. b490]
MRTTWGSATDCGPFRRLNEDALFACPPLFVVADGMGGHDAGEVAARIAVEEAGRLADRRTVAADDVHLVVREISARVRGAAPAGRTMGTTFAGVGVAHHHGAAYWLVFNIGDSRVYRYAGGELDQISVDHSVVQELVDRGVIAPDEALHHPDRHVITRAIGTGPDAEPDYWLIPVGPADRMLVCTDGLTEELAGGEIAALLGSVADPQAAAEQLVDEAVRRGSRDNVTAIVIDVVTLHAGDDARPGVPGELSAGTTNPRETPAPVPEVDR